MNTLEAVKATMKGFLDKRDADLQTIREGEAEIRSRLDAADEAIRKATEEMDRLWDNGIWSEEQNDAVLNEHLRTPYHV